MTIKTRVEGSEFILFSILFLAALVPRLVCLYQIQHSFISDFIPLDSEFYDHWAVAIARQGPWNVHALFPGMPLYAHVLGALYAVFGRTLMAARITQVLLGAVTTALLFAIARKLTGSLTFGLAVFTAALFFRPGVFYEVLILSESLAAFLFIAFVWVFLQAEERPTVFRYGLSGILLGLAAAARPNFLFVFIAILVWSRFTFKPEYRRLRVRCLIVFSAAVVLVLSPIAIRNYAISGEFIPFRCDAGIIAYQGNGPYTDGRFSFVPFFPGDKAGTLLEAKKIAERVEGRSLSPKGVSDFWFAETWKYLRGHPWNFLKRSIVELRLILSGFEMPDIYACSLLMRSYLPALFFIPLDFFYLIPLAAAGALLIFLSKKREWTCVILVTLAYAASLLCSQVNERYKIPLYPIVLLLAGAAIRLCLDHAIPIKQKISAGVLFAILTVMSIDQPFIEHYRTDDSAGQNLLGVYALNKGDYVEAMRLFSRALETVPSIRRADAHYNLGLAFMAAGRRGEATSEFNKALQLRPDFPQAKNGLLKLHITGPG